ncbi:hypothetical protein BGLT_03566 [Caballeronia glathei]|nr:hypothetical protein BGLT_03566 [Caballeronia glathei]
MCPDRIAYRRLRSKRAESQSRRSATNVDRGVLASGAIAALTTVLVRKTVPKFLFVRAVATVGVCARAALCKLVYNSSGRAVLVTIFRSAYVRHDGFRP